MTGKKTILRALWALGAVCTLTFCGKNVPQAAPDAATRGAKATVPAADNVQPGDFAPTTALAPTLTSISPASGSTLGENTVTITGTNFAAGAVVSFGGFPCRNVIFVNSTTLTCTIPAHPPGSEQVKVENPDLQAAMNPEVKYTWLARLPEPRK